MEPHLNETYSGKAENTSGSTVGMAVGLTLFFLLLFVIAGVVLYKYHSQIRNILQSRQRRSQKKENSGPTEVDPEHYTSMITDQSAGQAPIYENLTTRTSGYSKPTHHVRPPSEPEEDLYLECDVPDDAIYSNDPKCNLSISQDEDVYIMPDS